MINEANILTWLALILISHRCFYRPSAQLIVCNWNTCVQKRALAGIRFYNDRHKSICRFYINIIHRSHCHHQWNCQHHWRIEKFQWLKRLSLSCICCLNTKSNFNRITIKTEEKTKHERTKKNNETSKKKRKKTITTVCRVWKLQY